MISILLTLAVGGFMTFVIVACCFGASRPMPMPEPEEAEEDRTSNIEHRTLNAPRAFAPTPR